MTEVERKAVLQANLDLVDDFRRHAYWKEGMPEPPPRNRILTDSPAGDPPTSTPALPRSAQAAPAGVLAKLATAAAIGLSAAGVGAGGALAWHALERANAPQAQDAPTPPNREADVLQWLSEHGYDRPPGDAP